MTQGWFKAGDGAFPKTARDAAGGPGPEAKDRTALATPPSGLGTSLGSSPTHADRDDAEATCLMPGITRAHGATQGGPDLAPPDDTYASGAEAPLLTLVPGQVAFGSYRVVKKLGQGGMGSVWHVHDLRLEKDRALKLIVPTIDGDPEVLSRFRREAKVMARFDHPNAVTIHALDFDDQGTDFIVMEYVPGRNLESLLKERGPMPLDWVVRILDQLCDVLDVAHQQGIVHRDLKPSNLMLVDGRAEGREHLKVLDFGIAKMQSAPGGATDAQTVPGSFMGTPPYTSPEQAVGQAEPRSDLYSVGVILYELLTGARPFSGSLVRLLGLTLNAAPPSFATANPAVEVPEAVERVVMRCLAKDPEERPATARDLAREFREAVKLSAEAPTLAPRPVRAAGRAAGSFPLAPTRLRVVGVAAACLVLAGVAASARYGFPRPKPVAPPETREERTPPIDRPRAAPAPEISLDGRRFRWDGHAYLPDGYRALDPSARVDGAWPEMLVREDDPEAKFVYLRGGAFRMDRKGDLLGGQPRMVGAFYMQQAEVTNREMEDFRRTPDNGLPVVGMLDAWQERYAEMRAALGPEVAANHPATCVPWAAAEAFARARNAWLPTDIQWEFAAKSGDPDARTVWSKEDDDRLATRQLANVDYALPDHEFFTAVVEPFGRDRTRLGLWNMVGNVREMTRDVDRVALQDLGGRDPEYIVRGASFDTRDAPEGWIAYRGPGIRRADLRAAPRDVGLRLAIECPSLPTLQ